MFNNLSKFYFTLTEGITYNERGQGKAPPSVFPLLEVWYKNKEQSPREMRGRTWSMPRMCSKERLCRMIPSHPPSHTYPRLFLLHCTSSYLHQSKSSQSILILPEHWLHCFVSHAHISSWSSLEIIHLPLSEP